MRVAIFLPNWIGDVAMATPALRAIRQYYGPTDRLTAVARPYVEPLLQGSSYFDEWMIYEPHRRGKRDLVNRLRQADIDMALLLTNSLSTAFLAWRGGARRRVGFARYGRGVLLTDRLHAPRRGGRFMPRSAVDHYLEIAQSIGCKTTSEQLELTTTALDEQQADQIWQHPEMIHDRQVVILNTGSARGVSKSWPLDSFRELALQLVRQRDVVVLVICGPNERSPVADLVAQAAHRRVIGLHDRPLSIGLSKACIRRSDCLVTTDSGPRHLAAAFGVPCVALFGPTDPRWSDNYHQQETQLWQQLACAPCARSQCPLGHHRCMRDLSVERVLAATLYQLDQDRRRDCA
ncbi:MAG: lipopolysaccharide heptosyltransferase II [Planctomycetota bacterium]|nr:lipopolysaccharide heptosyltransferase II [Planctomycetota bacterium]